MNAIILATGETEKLRPLTEHLPAPLVPVFNRPVIARAVETALRAGIKDIVIALYHLGGSIEAYLGDGQRWGGRITYSLQREPFGSAGALKWAQASLTETFVVLPGDALIDFDLAAALEFHRAKNATLTSILHAPLTLGTAQLGADGKLEPGDALAFTGAHIVEPRALEMIPGRTSFDLETQLAPALDGAFGFVSDQYWNPLNTFADLQSAQTAFLASAGQTEPRVRNVITLSRKYAPGIFVGQNPAMHPTVRFGAPVCIGNDCFIGRNAEIGPNVVIGDNVIIEEDVTVRDSTILANTYVGKLVNVENRIVDRTLLLDTQTAEATRVVDQFLLAENSPVMLGRGVARAWDAITALLALIVTLPLTILIGVLALVTTGGLFAREPRIGKRPGNAASAPTSFDLWHFKTRRGSWLANWELHRLPEIWNVLRGDLGWVGVCALTPEQAAHAQEDWQRKRFDAPAGFTGLWYTQTPHDASLDEILIADAYYVATRSWREDVRIFARTPGAWRRRITS